MTFLDFLSILGSSPVIIVAGMIWVTREFLKKDKEEK